MAAGIKVSTAMLVDVATVSEAMTLGLHLFVASGRVYATTWPWRVLTTGVLLVAVMLILYLQRAAVFAATLWLA